MYDKIIGVKMNELPHTKDIKMDKESIIDKLRNEINLSKTHRHNFIMKKFSVIALLLGAGSIKLTKIGSETNINFDSLLILAPLIAIAFDLFIIAEEIRIKRAGTFIRENKSLNATNPIEVCWERFCNQNSNKFGIYPSIFVSSLIMFFCCVMLYTSQTIPKLLIVEYILIFGLLLKVSHRKSKEWINKALTDVIKADKPCSMCGQNIAEETGQ